MQEYCKYKKQIKAFDLEYLLHNEALPNYLSKAIVCFKNIYSTLKHYMAAIKNKYENLSLLEKLKLYSNIFEVFKVECGINSIFLISNEIEPEFTANFYPVLFICCKVYVM